MPAIQKKLVFETMRSINSASFDGSYMTIGTPLAHPSRMLLIVNNSGVVVSISLDGTHDHFVLLPGAGFAMDETANAVTDCEFCIPAGTQFYASGLASIGLVYLSSMYAA